jgi:hypothetical protein
MKPRRTVQSDIVYRLPGGNEDNDLWVSRLQDDQGAPVIQSVWEPTAGERRLIAEGANIELLVWGGGHPPVAMHTTFVQLGRPAPPDVRAG